MFVQNAFVYRLSREHCRCWTKFARRRAHGKALPRGCSPICPDSPALLAQTVCTCSDSGIHIRRTAQHTSKTHGSYTHANLFSPRVSLVVARITRRTHVLSTFTCEYRTCFHFFPGKLSHPSENPQENIIMCSRKSGSPKASPVCVPSSC